jgi:hypothetical protein
MTRRPPRKSGEVLKIVLPPNERNFTEEEGRFMESHEILKNLGIKPPKKSNKKDIDEIKKMISMTPELKKKTKTSTVTKAMKLIDEVIKAPKKKKYKDDMDDVKSIIKEVEKLSKKKPKALKKLVKADKEHLKYHPSEQDKKEAKIDKASLLISSVRKKK